MLRFLLRSCYPLGGESVESARKCPSIVPRLLLNRTVRSHLRDLRYNRPKSQRLTLMCSVMLIYLHKPVLHIHGKPGAMTNAKRNSLRHGPGFESSYMMLWLRVVFLIWVPAAPKCDQTAEVICQQCGPQVLYCEECAEANHLTTNIFHRPQTLEVCFILGTSLSSMFLCWE